MIAARDVVCELNSHRVLGGVSLDVAARETVALVGASGVGKSTLLNCLAGLQPVQSGSIRYRDTEITALNDEQRGALRLREFGFVFQRPEFVPELTLAQNIAIPLLFQRVAGRQRAERVHSLGERLELTHCLERRAHEVSGGELQRAAIARAIVHHPTVIFADEPTGALDEINTANTLDVLLACAREEQASIVLVTHDRGVAKRCDRRLVLRGGTVVDDVDPLER